MRRMQFKRAFLGAYVHLNAFDGRAKFSTWLTRIAINAALMKVRKNRLFAKFRWRTQPKRSSRVPNMNSEIHRRLIRSNCPSLRTTTLVASVSLEQGISSFGRTAIAFRLA